MSNFYHAMWPWILIAISIFADVIAANEFSSIAEDKGYSGYFWWCLLVPPLGIMMVVALPDKKGRDQIISAIMSGQQSQKSQYGQQPMSPYQQPQQAYRNNNLPPL